MTQGVIFLEFKKSMGKGYKADEVRAFVTSYEADFEHYHLGLVNRIAELTEEIETLKQTLIQFEEKEAEFSEIETAIKEQLFNIYIDSTSAIFKTTQGFDVQEEELNQKVLNRETELSNVQQVTDQLCNEIELLTKGYDHVLKGVNE